MTTRKSGIFALALMTAVFAACDEDTPPTVPPPAVEVQVLPSTISVDSGKTGTLVAVVRNATNAAVTWASSDAAVATVNANGVVSGLKVGQATITATSAADPNAKGVAVVTVVRPAGQGSGENPVISIRSVTQFSTNNPVPVNNVQGQIDVTVDFELRGAPVSRLEVLVDQTVACSQSFSTTGELEVDGAAGLTIVCSINTAEVAANGTPRFANGPHTVSARLVTGTGSVAANSSTNLTFANQDQLQVSATASGATATDNAGLVWATGDINATATPAIFSGANGNVARVIFSVRDANTNAVLATIEDTSAPFSATFSKTATPENAGQNVAGVERPVVVVVTSVTTGGQPGPQGQSGTPAAPAIRLDNVAPAAGTGAFANPVWFSTITSLASADRVTGLNTMVDGGVNRVSVALQYHTNPVATNDSANWKAFTAVSALPETNTTGELAFRAVVCDALNNCTPVAPVLAGVDRTAPTIRVATGAPANNAINPAGGLTIIGTDAISGVDSVRVRISGLSVFEVNANANTDLRCYDATGAAVAAVAGACPLQSVQTIAGPGATENQATIPVPADDNWYAMEITTVDVAGNVSTTSVTRNYLRDVTAPSATIASTTISGTNSTISGTVTDNVQVRAYDARFDFGALGGGVPGLIPFSGATTVDATLDNPLTGQAAANATSSLVVRELYQGVGGTLFTPSAYGFGVFDMANNFGFAGSGITFGAGDGVANTSALAITPAPAILCRTGTSAACGAANVSNTSSTLTAELLTTVPPVGQVYPNPVARVYFYYTNPGADGNFATAADNYLVLLGSTDASAATVETSATNGQRTFRFTTTLAAASLPQVGIFPIHAIAVDAQGDAILVSSTADVR